MANDFEFGTDWRADTGKSRDYGSGIPARDSIEISVNGDDDIIVNGFNIRKLFIDITSMTADFDVSKVPLSNLADNAIIVVRKFNNDPFKITFTDSKSLLYTFADLRGEFVSCVYSKASNQLSVI